jgi:NAD(P)-dependent dehydrogenase (short-subunit alcohol dehydrogenase family)
VTALHHSPELSHVQGGSVVVLGGTRGIGAACADAFTRLGANVSICGRDAVRGERVAADLTSRGDGRCTFEVCEIGDLDSVRRFVDGAAQREGRIDCLINNAVTYPPGGPIDQVDLGVMAEALRVNLLSYVAASQAALPYLRVSHGAIINLGSMVGELGGYGTVVYGTIKGAITAFTRSLAVEEAAAGVRVNAILPGAVRPDDGPADPRWDRTGWMGRQASTAEIADAAVFLGTGRSSFVTGVALNVSGGADLGYGVKGADPEIWLRGG